MTQEINVGIIGTRFMGRAHSNAYMDVAHYFNLPMKPVMKLACGKECQEDLDAFANQFGWQATECDWQKVVERDDIDMVDICTSNATHMPIAIAAAKRGKHVLCEKPMAMNAAEARCMLDAVSEAGVTNMVAFNYRRVPAIALAKQMIAQGKLGKIRHFNAVYYQDWLVDPNFPIVWRHDIKQAGSGAHGDMNAHIVDLARFLVGDIEAVNGMTEIFIKERPLADGSGRGPVTADDAATFLARFQSGAMGSFQCTRLATGRKNFLRLEIFGSQGSLNFNLERLNELEYYSLADETIEQGFRTILVTEPQHPYLKAWWPAGHIIGWEHTFIHEIADFLQAAGEKKPVQADFYDGLRCQEVLDAVMVSANDQCWVTIPETGR
ncbi:MAG: Gfo/Idh/MocA family oxidoreductase [Anaerolineaceae bacterium]|nr:Gfo/Idh/MocA family oxidoreductase [Anaerolineaceae bacterium]